MSVARFIADQRTNYRVPVAVCCAILGLSVSWFYKWIKTPVTAQLTRRREIDAGNPPPDSADPRFQRGKYYAMGADAAYGVAGIIGLAAIYYTFRDKGPSSSATIDVRSLALMPDLGPDHAGLAMEMSW